MAKMYLRSAKGKVINWTNDMTASANITVNDLIHLGRGYFGVAADDIAHDAVGAVIVEGDFVGDVILNESLGIGQMLRNSSSNIAVVTTLATHTLTAGATADVPWPTNARLMNVVTASGTATTTINLRLNG